MPARAESMVCSASGNNTNGTAIHINPRSATRHQSLRYRRGARAPGSSTRVDAPNSNRSHATVSGAKSSILSLIRRNEVPHMSPTPTKRSQSREVNDAAREFEKLFMPTEILAKRTEPLGKTAAQVSLPQIGRAHV